MNLKPIIFHNSLQELEGFLATKNWLELEVGLINIRPYIHYYNLEDSIRVLEILDEYCRKSGERKDKKFRQEGVFWDSACKNLANAMLNICEECLDFEKYDLIHYRILLVKAKSLIKSPSKSQKYIDELTKVSDELDDAIDFFAIREEAFLQISAMNLLNRISFFFESLDGSPHDVSFGSAFDVFEVAEREVIRSEIRFENIEAKDEEVRNNSSDYFLDEADAIRSGRIESFENSVALVHIMRSCRVNLMFLSLATGKDWRARTLAEDLEQSDELLPQNPKIRKVIRMIADGETNFEKIRRIAGGQLPIID